MTTKRSRYEFSILSSNISSLEQSTTIWPVECPPSKSNSTLLSGSQCMVTYAPTIESLWAMEPIWESSSTTTQLSNPTPTEILSTIVPTAIASQ
jgi:hypothetical protein